jgi:hypothetical protein
MLGFEPLCLSTQTVISLSLKKLMVVAHVCWRLSIVNLECNCGTRGILREILAKVWRLVFFSFSQETIRRVDFFVCCGVFWWSGLFSGGMGFFVEVCVE